MRKKSLVIILGGGEIGSAIGCYLIKSGIPTGMVLSENEHSLRRMVCFSDARITGKKIVENVTGILITPEDLSAHFSDDAGERWERAIWYRIRNRELPLWTISEFPDYLEKLKPEILILTNKETPEDISFSGASFVIGLYPYHKPGKDCHLAIESRLNFWLGEASREEPPARLNLDQNFFKNPIAEVNTPIEGVFVAIKDIGEKIRANEPIGKVGDIEIRSPYHGQIWGLVHSGRILSAGETLAQIFQGLPSDAYASLSYYQRTIAGAVLNEVIKYLHTK